MVAHPVPPANGEENPESLRRRLLQELSAARIGLTEASETLREAGDIGARFRHGLQAGLPALLLRHPFGWTLGLAVAGFATARILLSPPRRSAPLAPPQKTGGKMVKQLLLTGAGLLLKPAIKDFVIKQIKESFSQPKRPSRS